MASGGGAWSSETFDNGRSDFRQPGGNQANMGASATPPAMYNTTSKSREPNLWGVVAVCLRLAQILFSLVALAVMAANKDSYYDYDVNFSNVKAFIGIVAMNCIVCFYSIVQLVVCFVSLATKGSLVSSATTGFAILTFVFDTVLAYALMGASAAAADSAAIMEKANLCDDVNKFCQQGQAAVAVSFIGFILVAVSGFLYVVRLLRLKG